MSAIQAVIDFILHIDVHLAELVASYGTLVYAILFGIVFAETGFVVTPFLPGDSLLFAAGALAALGSMNVAIVAGVLFLAAIAGDAANYWIGHFFGQKIIDSPKFPFINKEHIDKAQVFYEKHGGKAIILSRFVPIVRTFAPFVAGVGRMHYERFTLFNIIGGAVWVALFVFAGYFFGNIPSVKHNFSLVILGIIAISVLPIIWEAWQAKRKKV
ncbi:MAG: DedA family protein [Candidatus Paceibacterota bacterium]